MGSASEVGSSSVEWGHRVCSGVSECEVGSASVKWGQRV